MRMPWDELGDWTGRTVLVTGGAGYLGRHLTVALRRLGATVRVIDVVKPRDMEGLEVITGDLRDRDTVARAVAGCDVVFHTAAIVSLLGIAPKKVHDLVWSINVTATERVVEACVQAGVRALVSTSSANVVLDREVTDEDESAPFATTFVDIYGKTKVHAEKHVRLANGIGTLRTAVIRPGGIWGPGEGGFMIRAFLDQLAAGRFVATIGDGKAVVDNTHVDTLVFGELLAARRLLEDPEGVAGEAFFITDDERINGIAWFKPIVDGLGYRWPTARLPGKLMYALAWMAEVTTLLGVPEPTLTRIGVLKLIRTSSVSVSRARSVLGWRPLWTSPEGIAEHLADYKAYVDARKAGA